MKTLSILTLAVVLATLSLACESADETATLNLNESLETANPSTPILWRNQGDGVYEAANPAMDWAAPENTRWSIPLATSNASPIKIGDRLYCTEEPSTLVCVSADTGEVLWKRENDYLSLLGLSDEAMRAAKETIARSDLIRKKADRLSYDMNRIEIRANRTNDWDRLGPIYMEKFYAFEALKEEKKALQESSPHSEVIMPTAQIGNGYTSYVPTSDGSRVYACFGTGIVVAYDFEGNRVWHTNVGHPDHGYGGSTFPVLVDDTIVVRFSDYVALDKRTGEILWRTPSNLTFGSFIAFEVENEHYLFTGRGGLIRARDGLQLKEDLVAFDPETGFLEAFNSPVLRDGMIYFTQGAHEAPGTETAVSAFKVPTSKYELEIYGLDRLWKTKLDETSFFSSPLAYDGLVYVAGRDRVLTVLEADTGSIVYQQKLKGARDPIFSSVTLAGESVFLASEDGLALFIEPGREYKERARSRASLFRSTPLFDGERTYVRTWEGLMSLEKVEQSVNFAYSE